MKLIIGASILILISCSHASAQRDIIRAKVCILKIDTTQDIFNYLAISSKNKNLEGWGLWYSKNENQFKVLREKDIVSTQIKKKYPDQFLIGNDTVSLRGHAIMNPPLFDGKIQNYYQLVKILK